MLDHDELLPEERANPGLVQELRTTYQMKPEEQQVLARVYQRLAQNAQPLPLAQPELAQTGGSTQRRQHVSPVSLPSRANRPRQRWLQSLNSLVAVLFVGLLVGSLAFTFSLLNHTRVGSPHPTVVASNAMRVELVPAQKGSKPPQAQMETTRNMLAARLTNFGLQGFSVRVQTINGQPGIVMEVPHFGGNEQQTINRLVQTGTLAFWDTGPYGQAAIGTAFDPSPYVEFNPGGKPHFTNQDIDLSVLTFSLDPTTGVLALNCMMKGDALNRFQRFTASNIGHVLAVTLDGIVVSSGAIERPISGPFALDTNFTQQEGNAIVSALKFGPLPVELKKLG